MTTEETTDNVEAADEAKKQFRKGLNHYKKGDFETAVKELERAFKFDRDDPVYMSYFGVCAARRWGEVGQGLELCTKAIKKEFYRPELYVNLSRVYIVANNKRGAITVVRKGLFHDAENDDLHDLLVELGVRRKPVIPFFKRSNPLNHILGVLFRRTLPDLFRKKRPEKPEEQEDVDVGL